MYTYIYRERERKKTLVYPTYSDVVSSSNRLWLDLGIINKTEAPGSITERGGARRRANCPRPPVRHRSPRSVRGFWMARRGSPDSCWMYSLVIKCGWEIHYKYLLSIYIYIYIYISMYNLYKWRSEWENHPERFEIP